jgi:hypothetical protein
VAHRQAQTGGKPCHETFCVSCFVAAMCEVIAVSRAAARMYPPRLIAIVDVRSSVLRMPFWQGMRIRSPATIRLDDQPRFVVPLTVPLR